MNDTNYTIKHCKLQNGREFNFTIKTVDKKGYLLYIPGFQSNFCNRKPLLDLIQHNIITFDMPYSYQNENISNFTYQDGETIQALNDLINYLFSKYNIKSVFGASLSTPYLINKFYLSKEYKIQSLGLISPQLTKTNDDKTMISLLKIFNVFNHLGFRNSYKFVFNIKLIRDFYINKIAPKPRKEITYEIQTNNIKETNDKGSINSYLELVKYKDTLSEIDTQRLNNVKTFVCIGNYDNLMNIPDTIKLLTKLQIKNIYRFNANHILEVEENVKLAKIINDFLNG